MDDQPLAQLELTYRDVDMQLRWKIKSLFDSYLKKIKRNNRITIKSFKLDERRIHRLHYNKDLLHTNHIPLVQMSLSQNPPCSTTISACVAH